MKYRKKTEIQKKEIAEKDKGTSLLFDHINNWCTLTFMCLNGISFISVCIHFFSFHPWAPWGDCSYIFFPFTPVSYLYRVLKMLSLLFSSWNSSTSVSSPLHIGAPALYLSLQHWAEGKDHHLPETAFLLHPGTLSASFVTRRHITGLSSASPTSTNVLIPPKRYKSFSTLESSQPSPRDCPTPS